MYNVNERPDTEEPNPAATESNPHVAGFKVDAALPYYDRMWSLATSNAGIDTTGEIPGREAAAFMMKSGIGGQTLKEIWQIADESQTGTLDQGGFDKALWMIAQVQAGVAIDDGPVDGISSLPRFEGIEGPSANASDIDHDAEIRDYYDMLWEIATDTLAPGEDLPGKAAVGFMVRSKIELKVLKQIWDLADTTKSGALDQQAFDIAMKLIAQVQSGRKNLDPKDTSIILHEDSGPLPRFEGVVYPVGDHDYIDGVRIDEDNEVGEEAAPDEFVSESAPNSAASLANEGGNEATETATTNSAELTSEPEDQSEVANSLRMESTTFSEPAPIAANTSDDNDMAFDQEFGDFDVEVKEVSDNSAAVEGTKGDEDFGGPDDDFGGPDDDFGGPDDYFGGPDDDFGGPDDDFGDALEMLRRSLEQTIFLLKKNKADLVILVAKLVAALMVRETLRILTKKSLTLITQMQLQELM